MNKRIALIRGDGIGPEVIEASLVVLKQLEKLTGRHYELNEVAMGGDAIDRFGHPLPDSQLKICQESDAILLGAVGGPKWEQIAPELRPERGLLKLRQSLGLHANLRPVRIYKGLQNASPLRADIVSEGVDLLVVRELVGGIYFGERKSETINGIRSASDSECYNELEIRRIAKVAFEAAKIRRKKVTSIDKANVLASSLLWRTVVNEVAGEYPEVELNHMYVDNAAMQLVRGPSQFDVLLTNNIFGDILSDEASQISGSIGLLPSASLGESGPGLYEPIHGSAPDIAGKGLANPLGTILSLAMLFRHSLKSESEAEAVERAVEKVLAEGYRTADLANGATEHAQVISTMDCARLVSEALVLK